MPLHPTRLKRWLTALALLLLIAGFAGWFAWFKFFREVEGPAYASDEEWFKYGSLGGEKKLGIPYWIWIVLPRIFPDLIPGPGGYAAFGLVWEQGAELPVGFTKKTVGFPRVGNNCALCHVATYRLAEEENPRIVVGAPAHGFNTQAMLRFLSNAAKDARFNADVILAEIDQLYDLGWLDRLAYRWAIIPLTRKGLLDNDRQLAWMNRPGKPDWGPGRDDAFNLPKYFLAHLPEDSSVGQCDFGSAWNLAARAGTNRLLNWAGESPSVYTVLVDSSVGVGAMPGARFDADMKRLDAFLRRLPAPAWPYTNGPHAINPTRAAAGKPLYEQHCAACHEPGQERCQSIIPIGEIGTDRERLDTWTQAAADQTNKAINEEIGARRPNVIKNQGYLASPLDGLWMRAPYLHNGAVPNLRELLAPPAARSQRFYRGYDVYDPTNVGFISAGPAAARRGFLLDTAQRGNGNQGHTYGTDLPPDQKEALLEYLKTR